MPNTDLQPWTCPLSACGKFQRRYFSMLVQDPAHAQIQLLLVSDDESELRQLTRDLQASRYAYFFAAFSKKPLCSTVETYLATTGNTAPIVLVINFQFAGKDTPLLLEMARATAPRIAIECVVTHPPHAAPAKQKLTALGARLFNGEAQGESLELTLH